MFLFFFFFEIANEYPTRKKAIWKRPIWKIRSLLSLSLSVFHCLIYWLCLSAENKQNCSSFISSYTEHLFLYIKAKRSQFRLILLAEKSALRALFARLLRFPAIQDFVLKLHFPHHLLRPKTPFTRHLGLHPKTPFSRHLGLPPKTSFSHYLSLNLKF